jgi:hypothetical protein
MDIVWIHSVQPFKSAQPGIRYAIAHIRGGEEMGRQWYEDGKLLNKKNTFNDFSDCGHYLIEHNIQIRNGYLPWVDLPVDCSWVQC